jgi:hypothetical protein
MVLEYKYLGAVLELELELQLEESLIAKSFTIGT